MDIQNNRKALRAEVVVIRLAVQLVELLHAVHGAMRFAGRAPRLPAVKIWRFMSSSHDQNVSAVYERLRDVLRDAGTLRDECRERLDEAAALDVPDCVREALYEAIQALENLRHSLRLPIGVSPFTVETLRIQ